ncbi:MAG: hypothetical protein LUI87_07520 [Lachnospiraceae bacterium]|nr:hypothetical protein [Lachnospiraceae bacterium]
MDYKKAWKEARHGKNDEYAGYYCLLIAILLEVDAQDARLLYQYGPEHPLCRKRLQERQTEHERKEKKDE